MEERVLFRDFGGLNQTHPCLLREFPTLFGVATTTTYYHIGPGRFSATRPRHNMVNAELRGWIFLAAILTSITIPSQQILTVEFYLTMRELIIG